MNIIDDPTPEEGFEGLFCGTAGRYDTEPLDFDLHKAAKYVRENNLDGITKEVKELFKF